VKSQCEEEIRSYWNIIGAHVYFHVIHRPVEEGSKLGS